MTVISNPLYDILLDANIIEPEQLKKCAEDAARTKRTLYAAISSLDIINKEMLKTQVKNALELHYGVNYFDLNTMNLDDELINIFSREVLTENKFVPVKREVDIITVAMVEPDNIVAEKELQYRLRDLKNIRIKKVVILEDDFNAFVKAHFPAQEERLEIVEHTTDELLSSLGIDIVEASSEEMDIADLTGSAQEAPIIQLANSILGIAIKRGVSDIHIEPREKEIIVRYRQDGVLSVYKALPLKIRNALVSRYKIMAELDISERRLPQDGRIRVKANNKVVDFRVSTLPSKFGEKIVMRILDKSSISLGLDQLITNKETLKIVREMIYRPYGIIFVTGPTGSGKTTTLYSALSERNTPDVNISTAEDPIEYDLEGITQAEVNKSIGMDFAKILKAFLRQDPDIMLVGETRDKETAKIAVEAALTGHLVFTTLHTNDAPGSVMRLQEMEVEPFLISSSTIGIIAQRLLRRLCPHCKTSYTPDDETLKFLGLENAAIKTFYKSIGCDKCNHTGYKGRIGAYEVMRINDHIRDLIAKASNTAVIRHAAQQSGMKTLLEYSIELSREGLTSLDEVIRVTLSNEGAASMCPGCGKPVGEEYYKCPFCQYELKHSCPKCSSIIQEGWNSCAKCGHHLDDYTADTHCNSCGGEISSEMKECPWCFSAINIKNPPLI